MAKPNLTSIFTSTNQYSVLKLLKALCDAVDNIDYADNTEFTNFKEQVNTAVASLISTDTSLQEKVNVIERPNANTTVVNKGITIKDNGDVTIGRNLEVVSKTKLTHGFIPIHTYTFSINGEHQSNYSLEIYVEELREYDGSYNFIGKLFVDDITYSIQDSYMILGNYMVPSEGIVTFSGVGSTGAIFTYDGSIFKSDNIATASSKQNKLYRHIITLSAQSSADGTCRLEWISSNKLQCSSLQDLRKILNNPQMQSYVASNPSGDLFGVVISSSTAQFKKAGTTQLVNITRVSDTVTPL